MNREFQNTIRTLWARTELLATVTYVRPPALTHDSSIVEPTETRATCSALLGKEQVAGVGRTARDTREFTIQATELSSILAVGNPRTGDFLLDTDGAQFAVYSARSILGGQAWRIYTQETIDEDFGAIALAHTASEDHGDLALETTGEDFGPLYL